ncbi:MULTISPECIES: sigma-70 family RNA polymerase sigma factor [Flavobacteriaceae]|uniref:RNA polymerase sigma factor RpoD/SigA n=2 Tax=Flavobacteriaceae TaxID=49546 RepID=A0A4Y8API4_9FLAO|nr:MULTISPECIES: RNA polymerase sigma factor RpoD/SigA [Flavobacteriaceae]TEW72506.1 RNA polymerase sigma factor RpoD/SigA [Gramella jeungdoensis]GGK55153.1 RNA polymerase sigma factor RpoD [Lutibacter litoralis]
MRQLKITIQPTTREETSLEKYFQEISKVDMISAEKEVELAKRIKSGDNIALEKLALSNLRFVVSVAKQYQNQGLALSDLINEGNIGLIKAAKRFDETRGFKFISYAVWWIRQSILQALAEQSRMIRLPLNKIGTINKIKKIGSLLEQKNEVTPSIEEISETLNISISEVQTALKNSTRHISMDTPLIVGEGSNLYDSLNFKKSSNPDKKLLYESLKTDIKRVLRTLKPSEAIIIELSFGLGNIPSKSLEEIGEILHLSRERVRQIKEKSIRRLKSLSRSEVLKNYV